MNIEQQRDGQSLVIVTLLIVGMLVFAGLVTDGGYAYAMRRNAQNAADASAFAGAYELALRKTTGQTGLQADTAVASRINEYVERNGVPDSNGTLADATNTNVRRRYLDADGNEINTASDIGQVGYIPSNAVGVRVIPNMDVPTFFMGIIGFNQIGVAAEAEASMGAASYIPSRGCFPVLVHESVFDDVGIGDSIIIWDTDPTIAGEDGEPLPGNARRGWANFNYVYSTSGNHYIDGYSVSSADLKDWVQNGSPCDIHAGQRAAWNSGDYVHEQPGTIAAALGVTAVPSEWAIPIYDAKFDPDLSDPPNNLPEPAPERWQSNGSMYHIIGFAYVRITKVQKTGSDKYIKVEFLRFVTGTGINPGSDLPGEFVQSVGLTR